MKLRARLGVVALVAACSSKSSSSTNAATTPPVDAAVESDVDASPIARKPVAGDDRYERAGPHPVGYTTFSATDPTRTRTLRVSIWYPADDSARAAATTGTKTEELEPPGADRDTLGKLIEKSPDGCTRKRTLVAIDAPPIAAGAIPLLAYSHCHGCTRWSSFSIAERLASHGFAVIAPDHAGNTLYDHLAGHDAPLDGATLAMRAADVRFTLDFALDAVTPSSLPPSLRGRFDQTKVGVLGHSFGAATTGAVLTLDARAKAGFAIAAPFENALLPPTKMADVHVPVFFLLAKEDNSISEIGNGLIRQNFKIGNPPLFLAEVEDAGHWSFSDLCALGGDSFTPGCGVAQRQTDSIETFAYLDNDGARALAASYAAAFFAGELLDDADGKAFIAAAYPSDLVTLSKR